MLEFSLFKKLTIFFIIIFGLVYALPNFLSADQRAQLPSFMTTKTLNLGLDLQGGAHLVLELDAKHVMKSEIDSIAVEAKDLVRAKNTEFSSNTRISTTADSVLLSNNPKDKLLDLSKKLKSQMPGYLVSVVDNNIEIKIPQNRINDSLKGVTSQTLEVIRTRIDQLGLSEPIIQRQGLNRIIVELPGVQDIEQAKRLIGKTAQLTFHVVTNISPVGKNAKLGSKLVYDKAGNAVEIVSKPAITGKNLITASADFDRNGQPGVSIRFDKDGTKAFADLTTQHKDGFMAIMVDDNLVSAPKLAVVILDGRSIISGHMSSQESTELAAMLRSGALPAPVTIAEERTIGASLGADSIKSGITAVIAGFVAVIVVMFVFYGLFGLFANIALLVNLVLIVAVMTYLGATLTLPGIAGIVLTIGMAVDANVLIFGRIFEEYRKNNKLEIALDKGFTSAYITIWDSNLTTLIAAIVLFAAGTGPVKGFAITLGVGIATSMFTAIMLSRLMIVTWAFTGKPKKLKV